MQQFKSQDEGMDWGAVCKYSSAWNCLLLLSQNRRKSSILLIGDGGINGARRTNAISGTLMIVVVAVAVLTKG